MSIHFISGKPGGGKTLYGVRLIVDELLRGHRPIVTNVPLKLGVLNEFIQKNHPQFFKRHFEFGGTVVEGVRHRHFITVDDPPPFPPPLHITDRIRLIDEDEVAKFFTFRGNGVKLESVNNAEWRTGKRPDFSQVADTGVFYVLDEVHIPFNSRAWAETGSEVLYYLSQHRKLGDDVVCITQAIANVDKQFRSVAQDFTYIRNLSKQRAGFFRLPSVFTRNTYAQPATDTSKPMESGTFTLDVKGMASLYDTAKGVGIHGRAGADTKERKKGLHWLWFAVGFPFLLWAVVHFLPSIWIHFVSPPKAKPPAVSVPSSRPAATNAPAVSVQSAVPARFESEPSVRSASVSFGDSPSLSVPARVAGRSPEETNDVFCTGYSIFRDQAVVYFSDGTTAYSDSGEIQKIEKHWVTVWNKRYRIAVGRSSSPAPSDEHLTARSYSENQSPAVDYVSQDQVSEPAPVNQVDILPTIHSQASDIPQTPRINGIQNMQAFRSQSQGQSYGQ